MDKNTLKQLNSQLASSAQQEVRDRGLNTLHDLLIKQEQWVMKEDKDLKMLWEGLFFMFWHSDKSVYQRDTALKIAKLFSQLEKVGKERQKAWFEAFAYIFNMHWDKVDNYRIDKYLLFLRFQINEVLCFLKKNAYNNEDMGWFKETIRKLFTRENTMSQGIPLQICDVFLEELNNVDAEEISTVNLSLLLDPFLQSLSTCENVILTQRIKDKIFLPLLENNITPLVDEEDSQIVIEKKEEPRVNGEAKWIDGGKLKASTIKEIEQLMNKKYQFPHFNILLFAQEYLLKYAAATETREENRETIYQLYDIAHNLNPEPDKKELTFTQRMLVNQASAFMTKKMQKRLKFSAAKKTKKMLYKVGNLISAKLFGQDMTQIDYGQSIMEQIQEKRQYLTQLNEDFVKENGTPSPTINEPISNGFSKNGVSNGVAKVDNPKNDTVINIDVNQQPKKKKNKKRKHAHNEEESSLQSDKKRVKFNLDKSQTREFFMYGKVATQKVDESCKKASPSKGAIKTGENGHKHKGMAQNGKNGQNGNRHK